PLRPRPAPAGPTGGAGGAHRLPPGRLRGGAGAPPGDAGGGPVSSGGRGPPGRASPPAGGASGPPPPGAPPPGRGATPPLASPPPGSRSACLTSSPPPTPPRRTCGYWCGRWWSGCDRSQGGPVPSNPLSVTSATRIGHDQGRQTVLDKPSLWARKEGNVSENK